MYKKLSELVPQGTKESPIFTKKEDIFDKEIVIHEVSFLEGKEGEMARILFQVVGVDEYRALINGSDFVMAKLKAAVSAKGLPFTATLKKVGNTNQLE